MQAGTERPRFRQDLLAEAVDEQGAKYIDVMNPDTGGVFRFYEVEFSIACAMDGERDVPGLVRWAQDELGVTPTAHEVQTVIATLGELGYLDMAAASKAAAADVPSAPGLAASPGGLRDTVVDAPLVVPPVAHPAAAAAAAAAPRAPVVAPKVPTRPAPAGAPPGAVSEVSLDLSEHLAVGREDVREAVRESKVMTVVEAPADFDLPKTPAAPTPVAAAASIPPPERPVARPQTPTPHMRPEARPPTPAPIESRPAPIAERSIEMQQPTPVPSPTPAPLEVRPEAHKAPIELPKVPEKQPVPPPAPGRRVSPLLILLILVVLGIGGFFVWKLAFDKPDPPSAGPVGVAPVAPQPPAPTPAPIPESSQRPWVKGKIEMTSGRTRTILAFFPGTIEWIEASDKEVKSGDIIMMLQGHKPLEAQVKALTTEAEKLQADLDAAYRVRNAVAAGDDAGQRKAQAKVEAAERAYNNKADQLQRKTDQLEPYYVRLTMDGTLTVTHKIGDKIAENTPIATIVPTPQPVATFKIPPDVKIEVGLAAGLKFGEKLITCEIFDWEPEKLRITCPPETGVVAGSLVSYQLP